MLHACHEQQHLYWLFSHFYSRSRWLLQSRRLSRAVSMRLVLLKLLPSATLCKESCLHKQLSAHTMAGL